MASPYISAKTAHILPRLPLEGNLDLTYRCNNTCRHCWLWLAPNASEQCDELSFDEIRKIADDARTLGTRIWHISGGEPMLRDDFTDIFNYLTRKATTYSLNTNGTLITPEIAQLLKRKGSKMIALYGASAKTYDYVTRNPGGFEQVMRGFRYLQEAGSSFAVQLIPMRANWHEWEQMQVLAKSLSRHWRIGATWLYKSACGRLARNAEIEHQRLNPRTMIELDIPDISHENTSGHEYQQIAGDDRLFAYCIAGRRDFHIDPYGGMTFCSFIKDPAMRFDLRRGTFQNAWDNFIPSLAEKVRGGAEYAEHCGNCDLRTDCRWCAVYGYLEHGRYAAPVDYLCEMARENRVFKQNWTRNHRRYYQIGGMTIQVDSDLPIGDTTFINQLELFRVDGPGDDLVTIRHHFDLPDLCGQDLGNELYRKAPWAIYQQGNAWIYLEGISPQVGDPSLDKVALFNQDHTHAQIYNNNDEAWIKGDLHSLTLFPSDQFLIARLLADRNGCYLHSAGMILNGAGMLFIGYSEADKSTTTRLLMEVCCNSDPSPVERDANSESRIEILCDNCNIVRRFSPTLSTAEEIGLSSVGGDWRVYGTWSHGDIPDVSPACAPLRALCFIEQATENTLTPLTDRKEITLRLLACLIKPFVIATQWHKTLGLIEQMAREIPCYLMRFDKTGVIVKDLRKLIS